MKFKMRCWFGRGTAPEEDIGGIVESFVAQANCISDGGIVEDLKNQLEAQTKVMIALARELGPSHQVSLAKELGADPVEEEVW